MYYATVESTGNGLYGTLAEVLHIVNQYNGLLFWQNQFVAFYDAHTGKIKTTKNAPSFLVAALA